MGGARAEHGAALMKAAAAMILLGATLPAAFGQGLAPERPAPDLATDLEIQAAYCNGAIAYERDHADSLLANGVELLPNGEQLRLEAFREAEARRLRFASYLWARGFPVSRSRAATVGVLVAGRRGTNDQKTCFERATANCVALCQRRADTVACAQNCRGKIEACRSVDRCSKLDNLPF